MADSLATFALKQAEDAFSAAYIPLRNFAGS